MDYLSVFIFIVYIKCCGSMYWIVFRGSKAFHDFTEY